MTQNKSNEQSRKQRAQILAGFQRMSPRSWATYNRLYRAAIIAWPIRLSPILRIVRK